MFEKRPIWGIIVGLNVCVLIWLISVQEPVLYDASTAIISSNLQQQVNAGGAGLELNVLTPSRAGRDDRDVKEKQQQQQQHEQQQQPQYPGEHLHSNNNDVTSTLTTLNLSSTSMINSPPTILENRSQDSVATTTTDAINLSAGIHSLTSSLGTGVLDVKLRPTPSWMKLTAVSSALPNEDFNHLIDLQHFHYLVPQPVCSSDIQALILVHSAPKNHEKRQIIRETWASIGRHTMDTPLRVLFLLGAVEDDQLQQNLLEENNQFADMIQGSFVDDYRNMTYKHVMAFKWFLYNCPEAQILIKVDDDVYVNTPQLLKYLKEGQRRPQLPQQQQQQQQQQQSRSGDQHNENPTTITTTTIIKDTPTTTAITKSTKSKSIFESLGIFTNSLTHESDTSSSSLSTTSTNNNNNNNNNIHNAPSFNASEELLHRPQNLLFCQKIIGSLVKRSYRSKWRVGFKEYAARYYPPYCPGYAIIYSPDVIFRLYTAAQESKYFWIDDVHITGVLAQQTNTTITTSSHYVLYSDECDRLLTGKTDLNNLEFLFAWHSISSRQIKALWHLQMMSRSSEDDLLLLQHQEVNNSSSSSLSSLLLTSSSSSSSLDAAKRETVKDNRLSYNISNYITLEGFR